MSANTSPHQHSSQSSFPRLKLKVGSPPAQDSVNVKEESSSPVRPSYSPVTPTLSHTSLNAREQPPQWIDEPEPLPVSLDENPDAIALRATISILQLQRQQALRDIRCLDKIKSEALRDPEGFVKELREGKLSKPAAHLLSFDDDSDGDDSIDIKMQDPPSQHQDTSKFPQLPNAQNIARCPPVEWSKYHIAGEPLDRLHELQKEYPGLTEAALARGLQPQPQKIVAPYNPFVDHLDSKSASITKHDYHP